MLLRHNFDKSGRSRNAIFGKVGLSRGLQIANPRSIGSIELVGAPVLKLSDGSASGGDSLHDHGSLFAK
jgi:hypothetical protein